MNPLARLARQLNWRRRQWSTARDRAFHDAMFAGQTHDPFSPSYPGWLTIQRFADLAGQHIRPADLVVDLGCGPGEVTCELARRHPGARFIGVDHSDEALARGRQLVAQLGLTNLQFERGDLEHYDPPGPVGLVTMFDAFHHLLDPATFVRRVGRSCDRFFLIEPAGNWLGQWQKTLDLDWLAESLFVIRDRLEYQFGLTPAVHGPASPASPEGEPTEHRYAIDDFVRWFDGYGVDVRGTVAGLERYGSSAHASSPLRDDIGRSLHHLVGELEEALVRADLDLAAKHWAVYAERGRHVPPRRVPDLPARVVEQPLPGPYECDYAGFEGPGEAGAGTTFDATVRVTNRSWRTWDSRTTETPVFASYHWLDAKGRTALEEGLRSPLPGPIAPGGTAAIALRVQCPSAPGRYTLVVDLVHEQVSWFSAAGVPGLRVPIAIR